MSSGVCRLRGAALPLTWIRDDSIDCISSALSGIDGRKALVLSSELNGPLGQLIEVALLRELGVDAMFQLGALPDHHTDLPKSIVYMIRPTLPSIRLVAKHITSIAHASSKARPTHHLIMLPRTTLLCERALASLGVYGDLKCKELPLDVFPFDVDVLSLCLRSSWAQMVVHEDPSPLYYCARALHRVQNLYGRAKRLIGKGNRSLRIATLLKRMTREHNATMDREQKFATNGRERAHEREHADTEIDAIVMIDREVDMVTPMLRQLTYEGALDEVVGIVNGYVEVDKKVIGIRGRPGTTKVALNSDDSLYKEIRDLNFSALGPRLKSKAAAIQTTYEERHTADTISEMSEFMRKFKSVQRVHTSLQAHISLAEKVSETTRSAAFHRRVFMEHSLLDGSGDGLEDYAEEMIGRREPLPDVLRMLCLISLIQGGLRERHYDHLRRELVQSYGFEHMFTLDNLRSAGLFRKRARSKSSWSTLRSAFKLVCDTDRINLDDPQDIHFVFQRYAPLSARLVEAMLKHRSKQLDDLLSYVPGSSFEILQDMTQKQATPASAADASDTSKKKKVVLVFFVGGVTFAEISALRFLGQRESSEYEYIVTSTHLTNGNKMMEDMMESLDHSLRSNGTP